MTMSGHQPNQKNDDYEMTEKLKKLSGGLQTLMDGSEPDLESLLAEIERLDAVNESLRTAQTYTYVGKDGKSVLARDLEDERDLLKEQLILAQKALSWIVRNPGTYPGNMVSVALETQSKIIALGDEASPEA